MADTAGNLRDGVHVASAGGTWMAIVYVFGGYRWRERSFAPMLPTRASRLSFPLRLGGTVIDVDIQPDLVMREFRRGDPITLRYQGTEFTVTPGAAVTSPGDYRTHDAPMPT